MAKPIKPVARSAIPTSWELAADWYNRLMGAAGGQHHRQLALPAVLELLEPQPGEKILDIGAGQGVLAPSIADAQAHYTGIDASPRMLRYAREHHGDRGRSCPATPPALPSCPD
jgi:2-polyprenyl-3-methyl-5-hydroxy-6-metoxy-1,4-benzoquinol methylase